MFGVTILGSNSAQPAYGRHPAAQVVTLNHHHFLIDCGEGTQLQMAQYKIRHSRIQYILISHLHGDHYFGLPGLLNSMALAGRTQDLFLFAPPPLESILQQIFQIAGTQLPFNLIFQPLVEEGLLANTSQFTITCFNAYHRIACFGFIIREKKKPRRLDIAKASALQIHPSLYDKLTNGEDIVTTDGRIFTNEKLTIPGLPSRSYAYSADTCYHSNIAKAVQDVTLLYHETTYLKADHKKAMLRFHSTTEDAAHIACQSGAGRLIIGHFSSKYDELTNFLHETQEIFPHTELALEGTTYRVRLPGT